MPNLCQVHAFRARRTKFARFRGVMEYYTDVYGGLARDSTSQKAYLHTLDLYRRCAWRLEVQQGE